MAKVFYVHQKREDYDYLYFFKNNKKMEAAKVELDKPYKGQDQEDYDQNKEWGVESINGGSFSYSKGLAILMGDAGDGNWYDIGDEFRDMTEEEFRAQAEKHVEVFDAGDEQGPGALLYYKGAIKDGTVIYMDSRSGIVHDKGTQPTILVEDGEYHIGESVNTTFKYVPTFESFIGSQKLNEEATRGQIVGEVEKLFDSGLGIKKVYDQMKKSGVLKGLEHDFNGFLIRIKKDGDMGATSINILELGSGEKKAKETHQKEHGFPLDASNDTVILRDYSGKFAIYRGQWESTKKKAKTYKVSDFLPLSASGDNGLGGPEAEAKWEPVLKAFGVADLGDLVWLGAYFPEIVEEEGKGVKSFSLDGFGDEDPHGDADISIYKWKGMLLASHGDDYRYSGTLCKAKDAVKLAKLLEGDEGIDIGE